MPSLLITITVIALVVSALIGLAFSAKRFGASSNALLYGGVKAAVIFSLIVTTSCASANFWQWNVKRGKTVLVYEVVLPPNELQNDSADEEKSAASQSDYLSSKMDQIAATLKKRIDPNGFKKITVSQCAPNKIEIVIPEVDPEKIAQFKKIIPRPGTLEFRILANNDFVQDRFLIDLAMKSKQSVIKTGIDSKSKDNNSVLGMWVPVMEGQERDFNYSKYITRANPNNNRLEVLCIKDIYNVTEKHLADTSVGIDRLERRCIDFRLNKDGANRFGELTSHNVPDIVHDRYRSLGIIIDGELFVAPRINSRVGDSAQISGALTENDARLMVTVLKSGALPVQLSKEPVSETIVNSANGAANNQNNNKSNKSSTSVPGEKPKRNGN